MAETGDAPPSARQRQLGVIGASLGAVLVVLTLSVVWASVLTGRTGETARDASRVSDDFGAATVALTTAESLERDYRLEPAPRVRARFDRATARLEAALRRAGVDGDATDRATATRALERVRGYVAGMRAVFAATDRKDPDEAARLDRRLDAEYGSLDAMVHRAARERHRAALVALDRLGRMVTLTSWLIPLLYLLGAVISATRALLTRHFRRMLDDQRRRAEHASLHDPLTGLPNRTALIERFDQALHHGRRAATGTGLLLIDVDRFKEVNDTFGHRCGDMLLRQVGDRLLGHARVGDTVARLGGDEFAVVLRGVSDAPAATSIAQQLRACLEAPFRVEGVDLAVEASVGIVVAGRHGEDAGTLLQRADVAMYVAKEHGLGVCVYQATLDPHSPDKLALLADLRAAMSRGELILEYQPKVSLTARCLVGVEALVRWQHPTRGRLAPDQFIPLVEQTGLIGPLTDYVLDRAVRQTRAWADQGRDTPVAVNLSARNLLDQTLPDRVAALLAQHGVPTSLLQLEVTESAIMTDPARARAVLLRFRDLGINTSLDDFGAGYTSLAQLRTLPVTELKIDRSFVGRITEDSSDTIIVSSLVGLGHSLGLSVVAEGVETAATLRMLGDLGCDIAQGYHLGRPMPAADLEAWFRPQPTTTRAHPGDPWIERRDPGLPATA